MEMHLQVAVQEHLPEAAAVMFGRRTCRRHPAASMSMYFDTPNPAVNQGYVQ